MFFYWTSGRYFPRNKLIRDMNIKGKRSIRAIRCIGERICFGCYNELKMIDE